MILHLKAISYTTQLEIIEYVINNNDSINVQINLLNIFDSLNEKELIRSSVDEISSMKMLN